MFRLVSSLLPLALLVIVVGCEAFNGSNAVVDQPLDLGLEVLLVRDRVRNVAVNCRIEDENQIS